MTTPSPLEAAAHADDKAKYLRENDVQFCLAHLIEEMGEALAAAGKSLRWGLDSVNPELPPEQQETNEQWLRREMDDVNTAWGRLHGAMIRETVRKERTHDA